MLLRLALAGFLAVAAVPVSAQPFEFVALGDMPYSLPGDYVKFDRLIAAINARKPSFSIHVGDIKSGSSQCSDANFKKVLRDGSVVRYSVSVPLGGPPAG